LLEAGLVGVDITIEEFSLADSWENIYLKLSIQDRIALAIAKQRNIVLLPGDVALPATKEGVSIMGTLGVLGRLYEGSYITSDEYEYCLSEFLRRNGGVVRLPNSELKKRLAGLKSKFENCDCK
jgi:predicted nucleic acid-binding protein